MWLVWALACVHRVEVVSVPLGATLEWNGAPAGRAPATLDVRPSPPRSIGLSLPGYRPAVFELSGHRWWSFVGEALTLRWGRALGLRLHSRVEVHLLREHGGVGTWQADDVD